jgi:hypothetical protein
MQLTLGVNSPLPDLKAYDLKSAVLATLAYADVFDFAMTTAEVQRYLIGMRATESEVAVALRESLVAEDGGLFALPGREVIFSLGRLRRLQAARLWPQARRYGGLIGALPFVRMVAVTGGLAAENVDSGSDLDYFIVTNPGYLWVTRAMVLALDKLIKLLGQHTRLCPNFLIADSKLSLDERDLFTAQELTHMRPLYGGEVYAAMRLKNKWTDEFLPNASAHVKRIGSPGALKRFAEFLLANPITRAVEQWEMRRKIAKFAQQFPANGETGFSAEVCKGHFDGHKQKTMRAFEERIKAAGL